jgi:superfamily II DNA/RNA helicase
MHIYTSLVNMHTHTFLVHMHIYTFPRFTKVGCACYSKERSSHANIRTHRFLVMDEADRLLSQTYQGWIPSLLQAASENTIASVQACADGGFSVIQEPASSSTGASTNVLTKDRSHSLRKLLFSATLTRNPSKLAPLRLVDPVYFAAKDARYQTPKELKEFMVPLGAGEKPLALIHLLARHGHAPAVCFTNSLASAHRLYRLLEIYGLSVHLFSSELPQVIAIFSTFQHSHASTWTVDIMPLHNA